MTGERFLIIAGSNATFTALSDGLNSHGVAADSIFRLNSIDYDGDALPYNPTIIFIESEKSTLSRNIELLKNRHKSAIVIAVFNKGNTDLITEAVAAGAEEYLDLSASEASALLKTIKSARGRNAYNVKLDEGTRDFEAIKENSDNAIFLSRQDGTIFSANKGAERMFGYTADEFKKIGRKGILDESEPRFIKDIEKRAAVGKVLGEVTGIRKNGERFPCEFSSVIFTNSKGEERVSTIMIDISERKKAEKEKDILIKSTEESFALLNKDLEIVTFNNQFAERYRMYFNKEVQKGDSILDYAQPGRREIVREIYNKVLGGEVADSEITIPTQNGLVYTYFNRYKPAYDNDGNLYGVFVSSVDITERKKAQAQLEANEKRFRLLIENSEDMILLMDANREIVYISPSFTKQLGYQPNEVMGKRPLAFTHPDEVENTIKLSTLALNNPDVKYSYTTRVVKKNGEFVYVEGTIINLLHVDGVNALVNNFIDVTARKTAKEHLEASEVRYRTLFDLSPTPMFTYDDKTFEFIEVNKAALDFYGYTKEEMQALNVITMRPDYDRENTRKNIENHRDVDFYQLQTIHQKKDGSSANVQVYNNRVVIENKVLRLVQINDITALLKMEKEQEQANKELVELNEKINKRAKELAATNSELRQIAWMQSHLVRAPLARIMGLADILADNDTDGIDVSEILTNIKQSSVELDSIIRDIVNKTDVFKTDR